MFGLYPLSCHLNVVSLLLCVLHYFLIFPLFISSILLCISFSLFLMFALLLCLSFLSLLLSYLDSFYPDLLHTLFLCFHNNLLSVSVLLLLSYVHPI